MATKATLAALAKLTGMREGVLARAARADFAEHPDRFKKFSVTLDDLLFDYSKQRIDAGVLAALVELAKACGLEAKRAAMFAGEKINITEKRAVLHTALRNFSGKPVLVDGHDVMPDVIDTREKMLHFAADVREGRVR
jgi:glucose-6-phosphate isomerase